MKALGKSQLILQLKSPILSTQDWFLYWDNSPVHIAASVQEFKWWRSHHADLAPVLFVGFRISKRFTLPKGWLTSCCPRTASRPACRESSELSPKTSLLTPFSIRRKAAKSASTSAMTIGPNITWNNQILKMILVKVISLWEFDSHHSSYLFSSFSTFPYVQLRGFFSMNFFRPSLTVFFSIILYTSAYLSFFFQHFHTSTHRLVPYHSSIPTSTPLPAYILFSSNFSKPSPTNLLSTPSLHHSRSLLSILPNSPHTSIFCCLTCPPLSHLLPSTCTSLSIFPNLWLSVLTPGYLLTFLPICLSIFPLINLPV